MSRARPIGDNLWWDNKANQLYDEQRRSLTRTEQLEYLAAAEDIDIDDLLDEPLTTTQVVDRLRKAFGQGTVPEFVEERRRLAKLERLKQPKCIFCAREGDSTRHHFVNRWLMVLLSIYRHYADRRICCVPVCVECHRDLHDRNTSKPKHIYHLLTTEQKATANVLIDAIRREHRSLYNVLLQGDPEVYEACLIHDWHTGKFD